MFDPFVPQRLAHQFVALNNKGADYLERRQYARALACFCKSLSIVQGQIRATKSKMGKTVGRIQAIADHILINHQEPSVVSSERFEHQSSSDSKFNATSPIGTATKDNVLPCEDKDDDTDQLYRQPTRFAPTIVDGKRFPCSLLRPLSVLILFNAAIAQQLLALENSSSMTRAIFFYEMILDTQARRICLQPLGTPGFQIMLSCFNNLGHAQRVQGLTNRSKMYFQSLLSLLMWSVANKVHCQISADCFWKSVQLDESVPAAAA